MTKLRNGSQVTVRPTRKTTAGTAGYFSESNDNSEPSYPGQDWFNDVIDEIVQAVTAAGVTYDPTKITNLKTTVEALRNASNLNAGTVPAARLSGAYPVSIYSDAARWRTDVNSLYIENNVSESGVRAGDGHAHRIWLDRSAGLMKLQSAGYNTADTGIGWIDALTVNPDGTVAQIPVKATSVQVVEGGNDTAFITPKSLNDAAILIGRGQAWQDLTASRVFNVEYTNTTDAPIFISVRRVNENNTTAELIVDGITVASSSSVTVNDQPSTFAAIVPSGLTYEYVTTTGHLFFWSELR